MLILSVTKRFGTKRAGNRLRHAGMKKKGSMVNLACIKAVGTAQLSRTKQHSAHYKILQGCRASDLATPVKDIADPALPRISAEQHSVSPAFGSAQIISFVTPA
ncbi:hypothetical protein BK797_10625 [Kosakonia sacchari]|nr:hypothetical protein BK797_10625 [Kosakonia sacchari]